MADKLTTKQQLFVEYYLQNPNGVEAAKKAGYKGNNKQLSVVAAENLAKPSIANHVKQRITDEVMTSNEVLQRLSKQARASVLDLLDDKGDFDIKDVRKRGVADLVKKIKVTQNVLGDKTYEYEVHDAQAALVHLGKYHKLFDRAGDTNINIAPIAGTDAAILFLREAVQQAGPERAVKLLGEWKFDGVTDAAKEKAIELVLQGGVYGVEKSS